MDLLDRGFSLRDVGYRLSWLELRALVRRLPPTSALWEVLKPEDAKRARWLTPQMQLLGAVHDRINEYTYLRAGAADKAPPGIIAAYLDSLGAVERREKTRRKPLTASEIRARVAASMN